MPAERQSFANSDHLDSLRKRKKRRSTRLFRTRRRSARLTFETLEERTLLAAAAFSYDPARVTLVCGAGDGPTVSFDQTVSVNKKPSGAAQFDAGLKPFNIPEVEQFSLYHSLQI